MTREPRVLLTVGTDVARDAGLGPRRDYAQIAELLDADVLDRRSVQRSRAGRAIRATLGLAVAQAWLAFRARSRYDIVLTDGEHVAIPFALLLRLTRSRVVHVTIGHRLSSPKKRPFFRFLGAHRRIDRIAMHSRHQCELAIDRLGIEPARLALIPYHVDTAFWHPQPVEEERLIVAAGLEFRDYDTLFRAAAGLDAAVVIGASSNWSRHGSSRNAAPDNVRLATFDYASLRELYARAAVVVVPLDDVDNQAGITTILEAMAMGKPVVVSQSRGQTDVVEDRRASSRGTLRPRRATLTRVLGEQAGMPVTATGFYVSPGDAEDLRRAIEYLLAHPDERHRLGRAARQAAETIFTVEQFAERMRALMLDAAAPATGGQLLRRASYG